MSTIVRIAHNILIQRLYVRCCSAGSQYSNLIEFDYKPKFSEEEQHKILDTLNSTDKNVLLSLNVSKVKIKNMENYKNKKGPFKSLNEVLEVDGLGIKLLEKLCMQIISNIPTTLSKNTTVKKRHKQLLTPSLSSESLLNISHSVAIHLVPTGISWAKLASADFHLQKWGYENFNSLPKKMLPTDTFKLAKEMLEKLPSADIYIFEGSPSIGPQGNGQTANVVSYNQQLELTSMLLALINTSQKHNPLYQSETPSKEDFNRVHFLKSRIPARLFKTLVGNEKVSTISTVLQLVGNCEFSLPCSKINVDEKLKSEYLCQSSANKELLGQALMLVLAFTETCIHKNLISLNAIAPNKR